MNGKRLASRKYLNKLHPLFSFVFYNQLSTPSTRELQADQLMNGVSSIVNYYWKETQDLKHVVIEIINLELQFLFFFFFTVKQISLSEHSL